jgi:hypothetical protein
MTQATKNIANIVELTDDELNGVSGGFLKITNTNTIINTIVEGIPKYTFNANGNLIGIVQIARG